MVDFSDNSSKISPNSLYTTLFTGSNSMPNFYKAASYNQLLMSGTTYGWYRAPQTYQYYVNGQEGGGAYPNNSQKLVEDVVLQASSTINFADYDANHDSIVDALFIVHAGGGQEATQDTTQMWSHAWSPYSTLTYNGVHINHYSVEPEFFHTPGDISIGVFCHEVGHVYGLPDLYAITYNGEGIGNFSLMAGGSWNGPNQNGASPAMLDAWSKQYLGWVPISNVKTNLKQVSIPNSYNNQKIFKLWTNGTSTNEYYLIENRQKIGFDTYLPGSGLLIFHVDDNAPFSNLYPWYPGYTTYGHYHVALEQADGLYELDYGANRGNAGDPYPGSSHNTTFNLTSIPSSMDYNGAPSKVAVLNISNSGLTMNADMQVGATGSNCIDLYEPNDQMSDAYIVPNTNFRSQVAYIDPPGDADWYRMTLPTNSILSVKIEAQTLGSSLDSFLEIYNSSTVRLAFNNDFNGKDSLLSLTGLTAGTYYIKVTQSGNNLGGCGYFYKMNAYTWKDGEDPYEPNNTMASAFTLTDNNWISSRAFINPVGDVDWFRVYLKDYSVLTVSVDAHSLGSPLDASLQIYNPNGTLLYSFQTTTTGDPYAIGTVGQENYYYIRVVANDTTIGGKNYYYGVNVSWGWNCIDPYAGNSIKANAYTVPVNNWISLRSYINPSTDNEWYKVNLPANSIMTVKVFADSIGSALDSQIEIYDATGKLVTSNEDYFSLDSFAIVTSTTANTYYVDLHSHAYQKGNCDSYYQIWFYWNNLTRYFPNVVLNSAEGGYQSGILNWTNPTDETYQGTLVNFRTDRPSVAPGDGVIKYWYNEQQIIDYSPTMNGSKYYYGIFAQDTGLIFSLGAAAAVIPGSYANVTGVSLQSGNGFLTLKWSNPSTSDYQATLIVRRDDRPPSSPADGTVRYWFNGKTLTDGALTNGSTYYYGIFAHNSNMNFSPGIFLSGVVGSDANNVRTISATPAYQQTVLHWSNPTTGNYNSTLVVRRTDRFPTSPADGDIRYWFSGEAFVDTNTLDGTQYFYTVFTQNTTSQFSPGIGISIIAGSYFNVKNVSITPSNTRLFFNWTNPVDPNFHAVVVTRRTDRYPTNPFDGDLRYWFNGNNFVDSGITNEQVYYYGFFAHDSNFQFSPGMWMAARPSNNNPLPSPAYKSSNSSASVSKPAMNLALADQAVISCAGFNSSADFSDPSDLQFWGIEGKDISTGIDSKGLIIKGSGAIKLTSKVTVTPTVNNSWFKMTITADSNSELQSAFLLYSDQKPAVIHNVAVPFNSTVTNNGATQTIEAYFYCPADKAQLQINLKNATGRSTIKSIQLTPQSPNFQVHLDTPRG